MKYTIGIDAGTTNVKAVLFDEEGREAFVKNLENEPIRIGDSCVEMDMDVLWEKTKACIREIVTKGPAKDGEILGIGITGQGEGCWLMDAEGKPVQNAILWCDARATQSVRQVQSENPGLLRRIHAETGSEGIAGTQLMILKWMLENRKEVLDRASTVFFCKDWLRYKLTGVIGADMTDSGTSLLNAESGEIVEDILVELGLKDYISYIPKPSHSDDVAAEIKEDVAKELGLSSTIPVITGAIDVCATAVGTGAIHEGDVCVVLGTTCANEVILRKESCHFGEPGSRYENHPLNGLLLSLQPTMNGTPNIDWMLENISLTKDFAEIDKIVDSEPIGCRGVIYSPYISVAGERAPFYHPYARASFFGISQPVTRNTLIRSVYEGITYSIRDCLGGTIPGGKIFLAGGGAKSSVWAKMIADVMRMPVYIAQGGELGAKGVAMMVGVKQGLYDSYEDAVQKTCRVKAVYEPDQKNADKYERVFELYQMIREANVPLWNKRHEITKALRNM